MLAFKGRGIYEKLIEISLIEILCDAVTSVTIQISNMFCDARHGVTKNFGGHNIFLEKVQILGRNWLISQSFSFLLIIFVNVLIIKIKGSKNSNNLKIYEQFS